MENLHLLETSALIDLLAQHTSRYTDMMSEGCSKEDYEKCKLTIEALQKEIENRKLSLGDNASHTHPPEFTV